MQSLAQGRERPGGDDDQLLSPQDDFGVIIDNQTPYLIHLVSSRNVVHASVKMERRALTAFYLSLYTGDGK